MPERTATIASRAGLHARPASIFIAEVNKQPVPVTISKDGSAPLSAGSILSLMSLGADHGDTVTIAAEGEGADAALDALVEVLETDHDAP